MTASQEPFRVVAGYVDHIPISYIAPKTPAARNQLVVWLPGFTGTKESMQPYLEELATLGFTALSLDPWQQGERANETRDELVQRVFGDFRRHMWPILGQTALDILRVIDWAIQHLKVSEQVRIGGRSMGGDIAVAAAGIDKRIQTVATIVATPDWLRPGMHDFRDWTKLLPTGASDAYAQFFYDQLNPLTHPEFFFHRPAITFECGAADIHVPPDGALRFQEALRQTYRAEPDRLRVVLHDGIKHDGSYPPMWRNCLAWFQRY